jgi:hypothetical protein
MRAAPLRAGVARVTVGALVLLTLCACSAAGVAWSGSPPVAHTQASGGVAQSDFEALARAALEAAPGDGISPQQQAAIERALAAGEVTFEEYRTAQQATFDCFAAAGIRYEESPPAVVDGIPRVEYLFEAPASGESSVADACILEHSDVVDTLYILQPSSIEAADAAFEASRADAVACLTRHDVEVDAAAERADLQQAYIAALEEWFELHGDAEPPPVTECNDLV